MYQSEAHLLCKFSAAVPATRGMLQFPQNASLALKGRPHTRHCAASVSEGRFGSPGESDAESGGVGSGTGASADGSASPSASGILLTGSSSAASSKADCTDEACGFATGLALESPSRSRT